MLPEQVRQLKNNKEIVFKENTRPVKAEKIRYYADQVFTARLFRAVAIPKLDITNADRSVLNGHNHSMAAKPVEPELAVETTEMLAMGELLAKLLEEDTPGSANELKESLAGYRTTDSH